jgi:hypothetical protein
MAGDAELIALHDDQIERQAQRHISPVSSSMATQ